MASSRNPARPTVRWRGRTGTARAGAERGAGSDPEGACDRGAGPGAAPVCGAGRGAEPGPGSGPGAGSTAGWDRKRGPERGADAEAGAFEVASPPAGLARSHSSSSREGGPGRTAPVLDPHGVREAAWQRSPASRPRTRAYAVSSSAGEASLGSWSALPTSRARTPARRVPIRPAITVSEYPACSLAWRTAS
jgi:hypothetical protein